MVYFFNFCENHSNKCKNQNVAVSEVLEVLKKPTATCEILGRLTPQSNGLLDPANPALGHYVQYGGGDICTNGDNAALNGKPRQTKFKIYCSSSQDANVTFITYSN